MVTPDAQLFDWKEPEGMKKAGFGTWKNPKSPYDIFMESQGIPIHRAVGVHKVQNLPMAEWKRLGGRGTAIQLYGTEGLWGCYVVEGRPEYLRLSAPTYLAGLAYERAVNATQTGRKRRDC